MNVQVAKLPASTLIETGMPSSGPAGSPFLHRRWDSSARRRSRSPASTQVKALSEAVASQADRQDSSSSTGDRAPEAKAERTSAMLRLQRHMIKVC